ncbi:hypothetical protein ACVDG3_08795 [Meridianimarinicoccus sp. RP-17]|uniref:hypothetical protein n=1 Tax=Meridianimarinicoccus zhengii TaxID=2056810 RepID=UPI000DAD1DCA|nr:hypothetical protein [Phycocomes zhengii]
MSDSTGFVAGLGRCGTTMVMAMLDAGGIPVAGEPPDYEDMRLRPGITDTRWLAGQSGRVVKWIDPTTTFVPDGRYGPIAWLDRNPEEQARSQLKLVAADQPGMSVSRRLRRAWVASLRGDRVKARREVQRRGTVLTLSFEAILRDPHKSAESLAAHFALLGALDVARAASVVEARSPACTPDLHMEARSIRALTGAGKG